MSNIKIDGKKNKEKPVEERVAQEALLEQAALMDTQSTPAVEILQPDRDVKQEDPSKLIQDAAQVNDLQIPQEVSATVPKARKAKSASSTKRMTEKPPTEEWTSALYGFTEQQKLLRETLLSLQQDLVRYRGEAAPAQGQSVVPDKPSFYKADQVQPEEIALRPNPMASKQIVDPIPPVAPSVKRTYSDSFVQEMQRDVRQKADIENAPVMYENRGVRERLMQVANQDRAVPSIALQQTNALDYWNTF